MFLDQDVRDFPGRDHQPQGLQPGQDFLFGHPQLEIGHLDKGLQVGAKRLPLKSFRQAGFKELPTARREAPFQTIAHVVPLETQILDDHVPVAGGFKIQRHPVPVQRHALVAVNDDPLGAGRFRFGRGGGLGRGGGGRARIGLKRPIGLEVGFAFLPLQPRDLIPQGLILGPQRLQFGGLRFNLVEQPLQQLAAGRV